MNKFILYGLGILLCLININITYAQQVTEEWAQRYDGSGGKGSFEDFAVAVATDEAGNSYVTGTSQGSGFSWIVTIKYSPTGDSLWVVKHEEEFPTSVRAIAVDNTGGVYVTGFFDRGATDDYDIVTIRYDAATGEESWKSYYDGGPDYNVRADAIAVDNAGGVYITGHRMYGNDGSDSPREYLTIRYDAATGEQKWDAHFKEETYNGINFYRNSATALAVDNAGGIYVTGTSASYPGSDYYDYVTIRYEAATGTESWRKRYDGSTNFYEEPTSIAVDNQGSVYVTGRSDGDYATIRYDVATGEQKWVERYDSGDDSYDFARAIAVDNQGNVYVTGHSDGGATNEDYLTIRYDAATGEQKWAERYNTGVNNSDFALDVAVDSIGGVYVTGSSNGEGGMVYSTVKYSSEDGNLVWEKQTSGDEGMYVDLALDKSGNVFITGSTFLPDTGHDFLTVKYSQNSCPTLADASIVGKLYVPAGDNKLTYSLPALNATSFTWTISDSQVRVLSSFDGQGSNSITVNWPSTPNVYKVSVIYGAGENCPSNTAVAYVHVFDTGAGFVTGGGWFQSPANPDYEFMQTSTKAHFSLSAKYKKGDKNLVQGETLLQLDNGSFSFRSTEQQARTLVIVENNAFYRGSGSVSYRNSAGQRVTDPRQFSFLIAATDGGQGKGKAPDKLRVIVWQMNEDGSHGAVVYDNQVSCGGSLDEHALPCQEIGGGNIKIHRPQLKGKKDQQLLTFEGPVVLHDLVAYPTAFQDRTTLVFTLEQASDYTLELYDLKGALVRRIAAGKAESGRRYEHQVLAAGLPKGLYFARLTTEEGVQTVKIVLQR